MPLLESGMTIRDTYEVERLLGEGAFAEVYRVRHRFLGRQAMKVLKQEVGSAEELVEMLGEAILLSGFEHPNIVRVFDANVLDTKQGTRGYFTMEYIPGGTLDKFWASFGCNHKVSGGVAPCFPRRAVFACNSAEMLRCLSVHYCCT